uniref:Uncharacterized protein n=1 Tax=Arundo donax TaxID=35708 RepID=A0A0A9ESK0_ARUDO
MLHNHRSCHCLCCFNLDKLLPATIPAIASEVSEPVLVFYAVEAEPVAEEGAEEIAIAQDPSNPEPAQGDVLHPQYCICCGKFQW